MKCRNGTAGAVAFAILAADDERRPVGSLHHTGRGDSDHSAVPAVTIENNATRVGKLRFGEPFFKKLHDLLLTLLAVGVELIEACRQITGLLFFLGIEQFNHGLSYIHAPGGVDSGSYAKGDIGGRELALLVRELCDGHQRAQSGIAGIAQPLESQFGNHPVFANQGHGIGNRGNGRHLKERGQQPPSGVGLVPCFKQGLRDLEGDSCPAEGL